METVEPGSAITLSVIFRATPGGSAIDPDEVSLRVYLTAALTYGPFTYADDEIIRTGVGNYAYSLAIPSDATTGEYLAQWAGTFDADDDLYVEDSFEVVAAASGWVTTTEAYDITGVSVTATDLSHAVSVIDVIAGRSYDIQSMLDSANRQRDLHFLKLATAYQAAWMKSQPDYYTRSDVTNIAQDGLSTTFGPSGITLAPMARRALRRLSWHGTRSVTVRRGPVTELVRPAYAPAIDTDDEVWEPL